MGQGDEQLLRELHTGLAVVKTQQTEINRRLGKIEDGLEEADDEQQERRYGWVIWLTQTVGQVLLVSVLVWLGNKFGLEVVW